MTRAEIVQELLDKGAITAEQAVILLTPEIRYVPQSEPIDLIPNIPTYPQPNYPTYPQPGYPGVPFYYYQDINKITCENNGTGNPAWVSTTTVEMKLNSEE